MPKDKYLTHPIVLTVIFLRLLSAVFIIFNPFWGLIIYLIFDQFDAFFLESRAGLSWNEYQQLDKKLDWFGIGAMFMVLKNYYLPWLLLIPIVYRLIGQILFMMNKKQGTLIFFPNFFEAFFIWFIFFRNFDTNYFWLSLAFVLQILIEIFLHRIWPNYLKVHGQPKIFRIFGVRKKVNWG